MSHTDHLILTPNARLARSLQHNHAKEVVSLGQTAWEKPAILSIQVWLSQLHNAWVMQTGGHSVPLDGQQTRLMWQRAIGDDVVLSQSGLAKLAARAWQCIHENELKPPDRWPEPLLNDDQRAFKRWAKRYRLACQNNQVTDMFADLSALAEACLALELPLPKSITLCGFVDPPAPAHQRILDAIKSRGREVINTPVEPVDRSEALIIHGCPSPDDEIIRATHWARTHLEHHPDDAVAIVVPDLGQRVARIERLLRIVLDPPSACLEAPSPPVWHVAYGHPLAQLPMVQDSLALLALRSEKVAQTDIQRVAQSPWLQGWPEEATQRSQMVLGMQAHEPHWVDVPTAIRYARKHDCSELAKTLNRWQKQRRQSPKTGHTDAWAEQFQEELSALGFGFGRPLDSIEYQVLSHWHRALEQFSRLSAVSSERATRHDRGEALALLSAVAGDTMFREQDPGAPIAVLSVDEALGGRFDAVWLTGVDEETWPARPDRIPLIPSALQACLETSTPEGSVAVAHRQLQALLGLAPIVMASHPLGDEDWALKPTRLITDHHEHTTIVHDDAQPLWAPEPVALEVIENDSSAPSLPEPGDHGITPGGMRLLNDQAACPFKAFATHRLKAQDWRLPQPGIGPKDRGILIHQALDQFWADINDSQQLAALDPTALKACVDKHVDGALDRYQDKHPAAMDGMTRSLERQNLIRKILDWLTIEKQRPAFTVIEREQERTLQIGPLTLKGKPDRIDQAATGETIVIDYKTGQTSKADWAPGVRLPDGQLPAYALNLNPPAQAIAFGKLAKDQVSLDGLAAHELDIAGIKPIDKYKQGEFKAIATWPEILDAWRNQLAELAQEYQQGHAPVAPINKQVCQHCHLKGVCRIQQRLAWSDRATDEEGTRDE
ncbi:MAG: PD-(D/E)XK nuclease family protein [Wenzhouxiangella sp.]|nr:PD-(D/E)XK nuclease family protein [Wenzhouxiangella sp.]